MMPVMDLLGRFSLAQERVIDMGGPIILVEALAFAQAHPFARHSPPYISA